jgi:hypothetical protein
MNKIWLRDLFPSKLFNARVLLFEYDTTPLTEPGAATGDLTSLANQFIEVLCAERSSDKASQRPIVFLCHGFGGLLVKRALAFSKSRTGSKSTRLRSIFVSTYGILFFGTPHLGMTTQALLIPPKGNKSNPNNFMLSLHMSSELIKDITDQFVQLMKEFHITNFWEELPTVYGTDEIYLVESVSAAPIEDDVSRCGINSNHSGIVKFRSTSDRGYSVIYSRLNEYLKNAPDAIRRRWKHETERSAAEYEEEGKTLIEQAMRIRDKEDRTPLVEASPVPINEHYQPSPPVKLFKGRASHLQKVKKMLGPIMPRKKNVEPKTVVIHGMGGSGKTQFCLNYAWYNRNKYVSCLARDISIC